MSWGVLNIFRACALCWVACSSEMLYNRSSQHLDGGLRGLGGVSGSSAITPATPPVRGALLLSRCHREQIACILVAPPASFTQGTGSARRCLLHAYNVKEIVTRQGNTKQDTQSLMPGGDLECSAEPWFRKINEDAKSKRKGRSVCLSRCSRGGEERHEWSANWQQSTETVEIEWSETC